MKTKNEKLQNQQNIEHFVFNFVHCEFCDDVHHSPECCFIFLLHILHLIRFHFVVLFSCFYFLNKIIHKNGVLLSFDRNASRMNEKYYSANNESRLNTEHWRQSIEVVDRWLYERNVKPVVEYWLSWSIRAEARGFRPPCEFI